MGDFKNHEKHVHADAVNAEVIEKGKEKLKEKLLKAKLVERKKDVYYEFIEKYPKMLPDEEMNIFKQHLKSSDSQCGDGKKRCYQELPWSLVMKSMKMERES